MQAKSQQRCATVEYQKMLSPQNSTLDRKALFEEWMRKKLAEPKTQVNRTSRTSATTYTIPVVFHIIHNGEPIGTGTNIPDAQLISQINVLNKDYQRLNADASSTPAEFASVAGSLDIEFVLAKQDPEGLATNGIVRVQGTKTEWALADNEEFKALSYWPAENYLNIWIINFNDPNNFIGYAQLPESSSLPGLENSSNNAATDGVVINYKDVGSIDDGAFDLEPQFNKGRTATHEVGHFLGLRHIWGDASSCSATDYVSDTPPQDNPTNGCPTHPQIACSVNKMFQNYLDYTNDNCMNLFTQGQVARMEVILQNSPRRASLNSSPGASDPSPVANDLGIREIINPEVTSCGGTVTPSVEVRNYGLNSITSARLEVKVNSISTEVKDVVLALSPLDVTTINFNTISLPSPSTSTISFEILLTNGTTDGKASDNLKSVETNVPLKVSTPYFQFFDSAPSDWAIQNPDGLKTWENITAPNTNPNNKAMYMNFYDYEEQGTQDRLITPVLDLGGATAALLKFDRAYEPFPNNSDDNLIVVVTTNCSSDFLSGTKLFDKSGADLASVTGTTANSFKPSSQAQWATESISLSAFAGMQNVQVAFIGKNGYGNNLYLDNVFVLTGDFTDMAVKKIVSPSPVISKSNPTPQLLVKNTGSIPVTEFKIETRVNSVLTTTKFFNNISLLTGQELTVTLDPIALTNKSNELKFTLIAPNNAADEAPANNELTQTTIINTSSETIPTRENFDLSFQDTWTTISQANHLNWEVTQTNKGSSLVYRAFTNTSRGDEAWLVSPVLNFSKSIKASLFFDLSYAVSSKGLEQLRVLSSIDGGDTFASTQYDRLGNQFSSGGSADSWIPTADNDWTREYINLNDLIGEDSVRLAFVVTNDNGNNVYLDNIELYNDDNPNPPSTTKLYSVYTPTSSELKVTFNLPKKETARMQIYNMTGQVIADNLLPDTLNQTYTVDMSNQQSGIYIVRIQADNRIESTKVFIRQ